MNRKDKKQEIDLTELRWWTPWFSIYSSHNKNDLIWDPLESQDTRRLLCCMATSRHAWLFSKSVSGRRWSREWGKESMVILGRIFFFLTCRHQLDSYYHLALLMSLVGKTKLRSVPQQTALWSGSGESFWGLLSIWRFIRRCFTHYKNQSLLFFSCKRNRVLRITSWFICFHNLNILLYS